MKILGVSMDVNDEVLLSLYPEFDSILGPYTRKDGRKHIILSNSTLPKTSRDKLKTVSFPKALVESHINRRLKPNETVDHLDRNKLNDDLWNLKVTDRATHASLDATRVHVGEISCQQCGSLFTPTVDQCNLKRKSAGPFCSKRCAGLYSQKAQTGGEKLSRAEVTKTYYKIDK